MMLLLRGLEKGLASMHRNWDCRSGRKGRRRKESLSRGDLAGSCCYAGLTSST